MNLLKNSKLTVVSGATAAGTGDVTSSVIDTKSHEGTMFLILLGEVLDLAVITAKIQEDVVVGMGGASDLVGTLSFAADATSADSKLMVIDVVGANERFLRCVVGRATANIALGGIVCLQYDPGRIPTVHDASLIASALLISPAQS